MEEVRIIVGAIGQVLINFSPVALIVLIWGMYELGKEWGNLE
jgi:hypothetical protein